MRDSKLLTINGFTFQARPLYPPVGWYFDCAGEESMRYIDPTLVGYTGRVYLVDVDEYIKLKIDMDFGFGQVIGLDEPPGEPQIEDLIIYGSMCGMSHMMLIGLRRLIKWHGLPTMIHPSHEVCCCVYPTITIFIQPDGSSCS